MARYSYRALFSFERIVILLGGTGLEHLQACSCARSEVHRSLISIGQSKKFSRSKFRQEHT
jgi:hypothetical protein